MAVSIYSMVEQWRGRRVELEVRLKGEPVHAYGGFLDGPYAGRDPGVGLILGERLVGGDIAVGSVYVRLVLDPTSRAALFTDSYVELRVESLPSRSSRGAERDYRWLRWGGRVPIGALTMPELVASFTLTEQELARIWRRLQRRRWRAWLCPALGLLLVLEGLTVGGLLALWFGLFFVFWTTWAVLRRAPQRLWQHLPTLREPQRITLRESGVEEQFAHVHARIDWEHWTHVVNVDGAWILRSPHGFTIIPTRALHGPEDESLIRQFAGSRLCSKRWLPF